MNFAERLTLISAITALISSIATLATAIAQVFIARSTNLSTYQTETSKLFFHAKTEAYHDFFKASQSFWELSSSANAAALITCCSYALLFSNTTTCAALSALSNALLKFQSDPSPDVSASLSAAQYAAVEAIRQEFSQMQNPFTQHKRRI